MKTYHQHISNYIYNKFRKPEISFLINQLVQDLITLNFDLPNTPVQINETVINLPLVKNIQFTQRINRVSILQDSEHSGILKFSINKKYKYILNLINTLPINNLYYYSKFNHYLSNYTNQYIGLSNLAGNQELNSNIHPILLFYLQKLVPYISNDYVLNLKNLVNPKLAPVKFDLSTEFKDYVNGSEFINNFTQFTLTHVVTNSLTYSDDLFNNIRNIIVDEFKNLPLFNEKFNKQLVVNNIYEAQLGELCINILRDKHLLYLPENSNDFEDSGFLNINDALNYYLKTFNNTITQNLIDSSSDELESLQIIVSQYKNDIDFFINSFFFTYNMALDDLKLQFNEVLLPTNFSNKILHLIISNINYLNLTDFRESEESVISNVISSYFMNLINIYINKNGFQVFIMNILKRLEIYNIQSSIYFYGLQQFFKLLVLQAIVNSKLYTSVFEKFINIYANTSNDNIPINIETKIKQLYSYSTLDIPYFNSEIFNFIFNSVVYNTCDSLIEEYSF